MARKSPHTTGELLLEIGTEELPYQFIPPALATMAVSAEGLLKEHRLTYGVVRTLGTPRRLTLVVEDISTRQAPSTSEAMGPSKTVAFDAAGQPTKAAVGFAASQKVDVKGLEIRQTPKGEYLFAIKRDAGRATAEVLTAMLPNLIAGLSFPKAMRWNASGIRFARPIRWIVALFAGGIVRVDVGGIRSADRTWGHRFLGAGTRRSRGAPLKDFKSYLKVLAQQSVEPSQDERRKMILAQLASLAKAAKGTVHQDEDLLEQAVYTVEYPQAILGRFSPDYLSLPKEVLMTAMKEHQGFFSLIGRDGRLLPAFISVTNMRLKDTGLIREGNERVLAARLADARFFFEEDRKIKLEERVRKLEQVVFHQKLGTLRQKVERVRQLAQALATELGDADLAAACDRAALLSKADLVTGMVGEFPTLQGIMGGEYARLDGEPDIVCRAIREQYLPPSMEGGLPSSRSGQILSLADRVDSITAFFSAGISPTGSEDPFGLRRHATAIVRILHEASLPLDVNEAIQLAERLLREQGFRGVKESTTNKKKPAETDARHFIAERLRYYGRTMLGFRDDVMEAVLHAASESTPLKVVDLVERMKALQGITARAEFDPLMVGFKRAHRIVEKENWSRDDLNPGLFEHTAETRLHMELEKVQAEVGKLIQDRRYSDALNEFVRLKSPIDEFFAGVMVNADNQSIRTNRLSLLKRVDRLFMSVADFSQIAVQGA